MAVGLEI